MGVNSLPKTVTRQRRGCDLNPDPSAPESCFFFSSLSCEYVCVCFSRFYRLFLPYGQLSVLCSLSVQLIVNCYCL